MGWQLVPVGGPQVTGGVAMRRGGAHQHDPRVCFVTSFYDDPRGGIGRYEQRLYGELVRETDVTVARGGLVSLNLPKVAYGVLRRIGYDAAAALANHPLVLRGSSCGRDSGVLHFSNQTMGLAVLHARFADALRGMHRPIVVTVHDLFDERAPRTVELRDVAPVHGRAEQVFRRLNLLGLRLADRIIADSRFTAFEIQDVLAIRPERVRVVYLGVDPPGVNRDSCVRTAEGWRLLYVGSAHPRKNLATVIAAVRTLRSRGADVSLLIAGVSEEDATSQRLDGIDSGVMFLGRVPDSELNRLYASVDVFVFPSRHEGFGLPVLEAMASGCAVVASRSTAIPEVVGDAGVLVDPLDVQGWATAIESVLSNADVRARLAAAGRERSLEFTWTRTASETASIYREVSRAADWVQSATISER